MASRAAGSANRRRERPTRLVWFALPAAVGTALVAISLSIDTTSARLVGSNRPISATAGDLLVTDANNSPTLTVDPTDPSHLVVVNRVDAPRFACAMHTSTDSGATWEPVDIPFPTGEELPPRCFAPDAAFGRDGSLYVSFVTLAGRGNTPNAAWVVKAEPGEGALSTPVRALDRNSFQVRLTTDPNDGRRLWLSYVNVEETATLGIATPGNPVKVKRSDDGGATWNEAVAVSAPARPRVLAPSMAVGSGGTLYALYLDVGEDALDYSGAHEGRGGEPYPGTWSLVVARSDDEGTTWRETVVDDSVVPTERIIVLFPPSPSLAVDPKRDRVYVGFTDGRLGDADVRVWASDDGGATFGQGQRVNDTRRHDGTSQYLPKVAVAPDGRVDVAYYDRRGDPDNVMNEVSLQWSRDGGRSWKRRLLLTDRAFDSRIGFGSERGLPDLGSRLGLASNDERAMAAWTDTRAGTQASGKQDLAVGMVTFGPSSWSVALRIIGAAALVAAVLGFFAPGLISRRRHFMAAIIRGRRGTPE